MIDESIFSKLRLYIVPGLVALLFGLDNNGINAEMFIILYIIFFPFMYLAMVSMKKKKIERENVAMKEQISLQRRRTSTMNKVKSMVEEDIIPLVRTYDQLVSRDQYGNIIKDDWYKKGIMYYLERKVHLVNLNNHSFIDKKNDVWLDADPLIHYVDKFVEKAYKSYKKKLQFNDNFSGNEYELFCESLLLQKGWKTQVTKKTGDQGVDIIADKGNIRVAVQCKKHSRPIGNKSVQEVSAGMKFYKADYGVVVSNRPFTVAAQKLASTNGIKLLHHSELATFDPK